MGGLESKRFLNVDLRVLVSESPINDFFPPSKCEVLRYIYIYIYIYIFHKILGGAGNVSERGSRRALDSGNGGPAQPRKRGREMTD